MKHNTIVFYWLLFISIGVTAQQIKKESIDSGGGITTGGNLIVVHSIGEVAIAEKTDATLQVSEGFINPDLFNSIGVTDFTLLEGVNAYPNPTVDVLNIELPTLESYSIEVFDLLGKQQSTVNINGTEKYVLDVSNLETATYIVLIKNNTTKQYKTYKIVKN